MYHKVYRRLSKISNNRDWNNVFFSLLSYLIMPIAMIISTPLLIKNLGIGDYGQWVLVNSIIAVLSIANFGLGNAVIKFGAQYIEKKQIDKMYKMVNNIFAISLIIGVLILVLALIVTLSVKLKEFNYYYIAIGLIVGVRIVMGVLAAVIMSCQRYDISNKINIFINLLTVISTTTLAILTSNLNILLLCLVFTSLIGCLLFNIKIKKILPGMKLKFNIELNVLKEVLSFSLMAWVQVIVSTLYNQSDKLLINILLGSRALGVYSACFQLAGKLHEIPVAVSGFLFPKFSALFEKQDRIDLINLYVKSMIILLLFISSLFFPLFLFAKQILTIWLGTEFSEQNINILRTLMLSILSGTFFIIPFYLLNSIGAEKINTIFNGILSVVSLLSSIILIHYFGLMGAVYGRLMGLPLIIIMIIYVENKYLNIKKFHKLFLCLLLNQLFIMVPIGYCMTIEHSLDLAKLFTYMLIIVLIHGGYNIVSYKVFMKNITKI
ncbi:oligosaccharide flippase family protein [Priestia megaterium]|uniref:oligosaccharide flippase family protein n=1 Tax=Priestia megaterium TaxID=1404 RepID=UPI003CFF5B84